MTRINKIDILDKLADVQARMAEIRAMLVGLEVPVEPPTPDADGWIPWHGGECPVDPKARVEVKLCGSRKTLTGQKAGDWSWEWDTSASPKPGHIIAYRLVKP